MTNDDDPVLCIFAKAPVAGLAKTRLQTRYSAEQAGAIASVLIQLTVRRCLSAWPGAIELWTAPDCLHPVFQQLAADHTLTLREQPDGNLGMRMQAALVHDRGQNVPAAVIGTDIPHAPAQALQQASRSLGQGDNVFGPASDGGFWFYGLHSPQACGFDAVKWDADASTIAKQTLHHASRHGIKFATRLVELHDIDTPADLDRVTSFDTPLLDAIQQVLA